MPKLDCDYRLGSRGLVLANSFSSLTTGCELKKANTLTFGMNTILSPNSEGDFKSYRDG